MRVKGRFSQEEFVVASIAGIGLFMMILGGLLLGFGNEENTPSLLAYTGLILLVFSIVLWLFWLRPWTEFDDLQTPLYTGHHHDEHHADESEMVDEDHVGAGGVVVEETEGESIHAIAPSMALKPEIKTHGSSVQAMDAAPQNVAAEKVEDKVEAPKVEPKKETPQKAEAKPVAKKEEPKAKEPTASAEPQDLRIIEGIGKKTQEVLYAEGINTYAQVAALTPQELETIVKEKHGVRLIGNASSTWPTQAKYLAEGDMEGLRAYQATLSGGRQTGDD